MAEVSSKAFISEMEAEKIRLENSVGHLQRSIVELKEAIEEGDPDREFKQAIEENIVVIAKYKARIERLDKEITNLTRGFQDLGSQATVPVSEAAPAARSQVDQPRQQHQPDVPMTDATDTFDTAHDVNSNEGMFL